MGYTCEGDDTERCVWPAGIWSGLATVGALCAPGYMYSYERSACYVAPYGGSGCDRWSMCKNKAPTPSVWELYGHDACGYAYEGQCQGHTAEFSCQGYCTITQIAHPEDLEFDHFICTRDGNWVSISDFPADTAQVTYASGDWM